MGIVFEGATGGVGRAAASFCDGLVLLALEVLLGLDGALVAVEVLTV
jgi:hypothetical protein